MGLTNGGADGRSASSLDSLQGFLQRTERFRRDPLTRWSVALVAFILAFGLRYALENQLPPGFPYLTFFPAVIATTFFAGLAPGIAVACASAVAAWAVFIPSPNLFALSPGVALTLGFFVFIAAIDITLIHFMQVAAERTNVARALAERRAGERDLLFKELQHRVSNNLAVVSSLLSTQARVVGSEDARMALRQAATRVGLIARIQRELHDPARQNLDFGAYLTTLVPDILEASGVRPDQATVLVEPVQISADLAVPLGLIATELVSNAVEHAMAGRADAQLAVSLERNAGGQATLIVRDDGPGWPDGFRIDDSRNLGMRIVQSLTTTIGGELTLSSESGAVTRLRFDPRPERNLG